MNNWLKLCRRFWILPYLLSVCVLFPTEVIIMNIWCKVTPVPPAPSGKSRPCCKRLWQTAWLPWFPFTSPKHYRKSWKELPFLSRNPPPISWITYKNKSVATSLSRLTPPFAWKPSIRPWRILSALHSTWYRLLTVTRKMSFTLIRQNAHRKACSLPLPTRVIRDTCTKPPILPPQSLIRPVCC